MNHWVWGVAGTPDHTCQFQSTSILSSTSRHQTPWMCSSPCILKVSKSLYVHRFIGCHISVYLVSFYVLQQHFLFNCYYRHDPCLFCVAIDQVAQWERIFLPMQEIWEAQVQSLGQEDPLEEETATYSSTLAWEIPWTEEPGRLQSMGGGHKKSNRTERLSTSWSTVRFFPIISSNLLLLV